MITPVKTCRSRNSGCSIYRRGGRLEAGIPPEIARPIWRFPRGGEEGTSQPMTMSPWFCASVGTRQKKTAAAGTRLEVPNGPLPAPSCR
jgi:hypothetical protein